MEWALCERSKHLHYLPRRRIYASPALFRTDRTGYGFPFPNSVHDGLGRVVKAIDQNVIYWKSASPGILILRLLFVAC